MTVTISPAQARRRYFGLFIPAMVLYLVSIFFVEFLEDRLPADTGLWYGLALIPALCVFIWFWAHARYIRECDEMMRRVQIESILYGLMIAMSIITAWGFMEFYTSVPTVPIFYAMPGFYLVYGLVSFFVGRKYGIRCIP